MEFLGDDETKPAPGPLRRVQALINTLEKEYGKDRLARREDAQPWLVANDLVGADEELHDDDLARIVGVREALRSLTIQNTDGTAPADLAALRAVGDDVAVRAGVAADGRIGLAPVGDSVSARLMGLLLVVEAAQRDGSWTHLKACGNDECEWAFYDRSRNHGGTWCDMASCGNKLKNRDFRARRRART